VAMFAGAPSHIRIRQVPSARLAVMREAPHGSGEGHEAASRVILEPGICPRPRRMWRYQKLADSIMPFRFDSASAFFFFSSAE
jgi:hypothetical protein